MRTLWEGAEHTPEYTRNLSGSRWKKLRKEIMATRGRKCERCGLAYFPENLQLHHKHYDTLGNETAADVELLCKGCHALADAERTRRTDERNEAALYDARLDGWASKVYGEDWADDPYRAELIQERFEVWLENKRYD